MFKRALALAIAVSFILNIVQPDCALAISVNQLPVPGQMVGLSPSFLPLALKGVVINPAKPLQFEFIVDTGSASSHSPDLREQTNRLVKYFLTGLTVPEGELWVNLSPYEKERIIPGVLGQTGLGRDLLGEDYILKQLTASLIYPEKDLGREFWSKVYAKAQQEFGTTDVPVNTFNKVWILPDEAQVFVHGSAAYVTKSTLKVMLDEDYLAARKHRAGAAVTGAHSIGSQIIRSIILPEITKEVNTGKNFAALRQIYDALILAKWYKQTIVNGLLDALYTNREKITGINLNDPAVKEEIYNRYLQAYKKGVFNYIKDEPNIEGQATARKYFSGGVTLLKLNVATDGAMSAVRQRGALLKVDVRLNANQSMLNSSPRSNLAANPDFQTSPIIIDARAPAVFNGNVRIVRNESVMSEYMSARFINTVSAILKSRDPKRQPPVMGVGTGRTIGLFYKALVRDFKSFPATDLSKVILVAQDEYAGLPANHKQSYRNFIMENLIDPLWAIDHRRAIQPGNLIIFNGTAKSKAQELIRIERKIASLGGIDWQLVAGGEDGHFAFVEPAIRVASRSALQTPEMMKAFRNFNEVIIDKQDIGASELMEWVKMMMQLRHQQRKTLGQQNDVVQKAVKSRLTYLKLESEPAGLRESVQKELSALGQRMLREQQLTVYVTLSGNIRLETLDRLLPDYLKGRVEFKDRNIFWTQPAKVVDLALDTILSNSRYFATLDEFPLKAYTLAGTLLKAGQIQQLSSNELMVPAFVRMSSGPLTEEVPISILPRQKQYQVILTQKIADGMLAQGPTGHEALKALENNKAMTALKGPLTEAQLKTAADHLFHYIGIYAPDSFAGGELLDARWPDINQRSSLMPVPWTPDYTAPKGHIGLSYLKGAGWYVIDFNQEQFRNFIKRVGQKVLIDFINRNSIPFSEIFPEFANAAMISADFVNYDDYSRELVGHSGAVYQQVYGITFGSRNTPVTSEDIQRIAREVRLKVDEVMEIMQNALQMHQELNGDWLGFSTDERKDFAMNNHANGEKKNILLVDRDATFRENLGRLLASGRTYQIEGARDETGAFNEIQRNHVDVVVANVTDGINFARNVQRRFPHVKVVLWDDQLDLYDKQRGREIGVPVIRKMDNILDVLEEQLKPAAHTNGVLAPSNPAMKADYGGIDLNQIMVRRSGQTIRVKFDPRELAALAHSGFNGFTPVITDIESIQNPLALMGVAG